MKGKQTNQPLHENTKNIADMLPDELRADYNSSTHKGSGIVECLKVTAALKLWFDRGYRQVGFGVPSDFGGKTVYVDVVARDAKGMVGVECAPRLYLRWLRGRVAQLRGALPPNSYLVIIFPSGVNEKHIYKVLGLVDEVWVTGKDSGKVERMMFMSVFHRG